MSSSSSSSRFDQRDYEEVGHHSVLHGIEKGAVLQQAKVTFNENQISPQKCTQLITKILYLLHTGKSLTQTEATNLFFSITKLFGSNEQLLRRMVYLIIKELQPLVPDAIIVTSSLTRDISSDSELKHANALRALRTVTDNSMISGVERFYKQSLSNSSPFVASCGLVSGYHLHKEFPDTIKRWGSQVTEAVSSKSNMVQYHALGLLYKIKQKDRVAVAKLVNHKFSIRSPYAHCLLIRYASEVMDEITEASEARGIYDYLESCLRNRSEMVIFEAARAMCNLKNISARDLTPAITVLQLFLSSPKPSLRFAAVRTLNKVAQTNPLSVTTCNLDMENLIMDSNRSIATLAISTLLKTGSENSIDRLMKQISNFMSEIADEFKILVVDAIQALCLKYPQKHRTLLNFLSNILRDEGGFEYKRAIVNTIVGLMDAIPECKDTALSHLCEFIEDCEFTHLSTFILNLLGRIGPTCESPSKYIRYIYNRVILEKAAVRASAVTALAKFGCQVDDLRPSIIVLLTRSLMDADDEVRDRATFFLDILRDMEAESQKDLIIDGLGSSLKAMEIALNDYLQSPTSSGFDMGSVRAIEAELAQEALALGSRGGSSSTAGGSSLSGLDSSDPSEKENMYAELLRSIPQFADIGPLFHSSKPVELSEQESEYPVNCVKHIFQSHLVFQFNVTNTLPDALLENVQVTMTITDGDGDLQEVANVECAKLAYQTPGVCFVCLEREPDFFPTATFDCVLTFQLKDVDPETGELESDEGFEDEFQLEVVEVNTSDYMQGTYVSNFKLAWDNLGQECEVVETFYLATMKSLRSAVQAIIEFLGMSAVDKTGQIDESSKAKSHSLLLSGLFVGNVQVLCRCRLVVDQSQGGVHLELTIRSESPIVSDELAGAIA